MQVALSAQILFHGEFLVQALRLENDADPPPHGSRLANHVMAADGGRASGRGHQCREDAEHRRLASAVGAKQAEDLAFGNLKAHAGERDALAVAVRYVFNADDHRLGRSSNIKP